MPYTYSLDDVSLPCEGRALVVAPLGMDGELQLLYHKQVNNPFFGHIGSGLEHTLNFLG